MLREAELSWNGGNMGFVDKVGCRYDPYARVMLKESYDHQGMRAVRKAAILKVLATPLHNPDTSLSRSYCAAIPQRMAMPGSSALRGQEGDMSGG